VQSILYRHLDGTDEALLYKVLHNRFDLNKR
jgi:hypothetical protein